MNRLKLMTCYLIGPMDHDRESGKNWRKNIEIWLDSRGVITYDPYHKPLLPISLNGLEDDDNYTRRKLAIEREDYKEAARLIKPVRSTDLRCVDKADFKIVNLDLDKRPCGTYEEIFTSNRQKKPTLIYCPQGIKEIPHWLFGTVPTEFLFDDWEAMKDYLDHIDQDEDFEINTLNRWVFFDLEAKYRRVIERSEEQSQILRILADLNTV